MEYNNWKYIYDGKVYILDPNRISSCYKDFISGGALSPESKKIRDFEYWIQQPYEYLYNIEDIVNTLSTVKDILEYISSIMDDIESIYNEVDDKTYREKQPIITYLNKEFNFALDAVNEVETYTESFYDFNENIDYINQVLNCAITKIRDVYNIIKAGV